MSASQWWRQGLLAVPERSCIWRFPEFVETKQRGANRVNISPLAYSAAEGLGKLQTECRESRSCTEWLKELNSFVVLPLTCLLLPADGRKVLGCLTGMRRGCQGQSVVLFNPSKVSGWKLGVSWNIAPVLLLSCSCPLHHLGW